MNSHTAFEDIRKLIAMAPGPNKAALEEAKQRNAVLTKPEGALGRLEEIAQWLAAWQEQHPGKVENPVAAVFAGNHGVCTHGISAFPQEVTQQMVANFQADGAAINQLCKVFSIELRVFELALEIPTKDITQAPALDEKECVATIAYGMEAIAGECDLLCVGEMGIGNTTIAAALCHGLFGGEAADWVGPGTGLDTKGVAHKADIVGQAVAHHKAQLDDPLTVLACLGGREFSAMVGAILAARLNNIPVLIDGYVATAAAAVLHALSPNLLDHCLISHLSQEPAHVKLLEKLGKKPLLDLDLRLGEASGAALAVGIVKAAAQTHAGMATFADAQVSTKK